MESTYPCECFINHVGPNAMIDHVDGTVVAPGFVELAQVFLTFHPGTGMDSLEVHDRDISGRYGVFGNDLGSSATEDES